MDSIRGIGSIKTDIVVKDTLTLHVSEAELPGSGILWTDDV